MNGTADLKETKRDWRVLSATLLPDHSNNSKVFDRWKVSFVFLKNKLQLLVEEIKSVSKRGDSREKSVRVRGSKGEKKSNETFLFRCQLPLASLWQPKEQHAKEMDKDEKDGLEPWSVDYDLSLSCQIAFLQQTFKKRSRITIRGDWRLICVGFDGSVVVGIGAWENEEDSTGFLWGDLMMVIGFISFDQRQKKTKCV